MSSCVQNIITLKKTSWLVFVSLLFCVNTGCLDSVKKKKVNTINEIEFTTIKPTSSSREEPENDKKQDIESITQKEVDELLSNKTTIVEDTADDVVSKFLSNNSKKINIALVIPTTGQYASIGEMVVDTAMITNINSKFNNTATINVYDIGKLPNKNWQNNSEVQRLFKDGNNVIIGSIFADTTKKLLSVLPKDVQFISFLNDDSLTKDYPNLTVMSADDSYRLFSLFECLAGYKRTYLSVILPATKKGYNLDKLIKKLASQNDIMVLSSQFYQNNSQTSIATAVRGINRKFSATYLIDEDGKFITENIRNNKKNDLEQVEKNSLSTLEKQTVSTNAIYIDADEKNLATVLSSLREAGILDRDVWIFTSAVIDAGSLLSNDFENVNFVGYNYDYIDVFNKTFKNKFNKTPNYFSYITYDVLSMINYISNETNMLPNDWFKEDGFRGILDEFRFARDGNVERRMNIYNIKNNNLTRSYVPDYYYKLYGVKTPADRTYFED
jgi:hypothetical protein